MRSTIAICAGLLAHLAVFAAEPASPPVRSDGHVDLIRRAKENLVRGFKDPGSAQFRGLFIGTGTEKGALALCGEVNAKNAYGGYVGFRRFYATEVPALQQIAGERAADFDSQALESMWSSYCGTYVAAVPD